MKQSVVLMGTPSFCVPILEGLVKDKYQIKAVVTQPDRPVGRKHLLSESPAKKAAQKFNIPVLQPQKLGGSHEMDQVIKIAPDFIITAAYGQFLPTKLLNAAKIAAVNVHGSLLPKYRGGAPVQYAIMNGDDQTGITIMYMAKKMDAGDIIDEQSVQITKTDNTQTMFKKLSFVGRDLLLKTLPKIVNGSVKPIKQDESKVVFSPNIKRSEERLNFNQSATLIDDKVRALYPDPISYVILKNKRTKIFETTPLNEHTDKKPGTVVEKDKHHLKIAAGKNSVIEINVLQPAGKHKQKINDYLNGAGQNIKVGDQIINNDNK
ncbi:methionyl-tRNA formyltransferase [Philodulcilactobacillus myokoensis]|uniref:Methionyl-tRNA formyltransferase n=1 Tax=Philodulcilactobacillus myokoensis TaxID=2929573 RepID=A0A9W6B0T8_9LACO|nr:methionyl-tRNA formyltransferase [Philodulcilactobacillus myokoensis]GLB46810.1 methionyl-tRNA formyltransferase [Philodulcilactobacillus myokoensis]